MRANSVEPGPELASLASGVVGWSYAAEISSRVQVDALQWARACFETASAPMRVFLVVGWRLLLLQGGARSDALHVLGWPVQQDSRQLAVLHRRSGLGLQATLVFEASENIVTFSSAMVFSNRLSRVVWAGVAPIHRWVVRVALTRAATVVRPR